MQCARNSSQLCIVMLRVKQLEGLGVERENIFPYSSVSSSNANESFWTCVSYLGFTSSGNQRDNMYDLQGLSTKVFQRVSKYVYA